MRPVGLISTIALLVVGLAACDDTNGESTPTDAGEQADAGEESPLLVSHMDIEGPDNSLVGYVVIEPVCVYSHLTEPESPKWPDRAVIWPRGTVLDVGAHAVVLPDGDTLVHEQETHFSGAGFAFDLESSLMDDASVSPVAAKCAERFDGMIAFGGVIPYEPTP